MAAVKACWLKTALERRKFRVLIILALLPSMTVAGAAQSFPVKVKSFVQHNKLFLSGAAASTIAGSTSGNRAVTLPLVAATSAFSFVLAKRLKGNLHAISIAPQMGAAAYSSTVDGNAQQRLITLEDPCRNMVSCKTVHR